MRQTSVGVLREPEVGQLLVGALLHEGLVHPHGLACPALQALGKNGLFTIEKRVIGPFQRGISALFVLILYTCCGPTPLPMGISAMVMNIEISRVDRKSIKRVGLVLLVGLV